MRRPTAYPPRSRGPSPVALGLIISAAFFLAAAAVPLLLGR